MTLRRERVTHIAGRALAYFAVVFGAGFVLGVVRTMLVVPRLGDRLAELAETPLMLLVVYFTARFLVRRASPWMKQREWLAVGCVALVLMLITEFTVVLWIRGLSLREYLASRDPFSGGTYLAALAVFAICPWWVFRRRSKSYGPSNRQTS